MTNSSYEIIKNFDALPDRCKELFFTTIIPGNCYCERFKETMLTTFIPLTEFGFGDCKTPYETIFAFAFNLCSLHYRTDAICHVHSDIYYNCLPYNVDFEIVPFLNDKRRKVVVEIGNKNKYEKYFKKLDYDVVTFKNAEVYNNPIYCAEKIIKKFDSRKAIDDEKDMWETLNHILKINRWRA